MAPSLLKETAHTEINPESELLKAKVRVHLKKC